MKRGDVVISAAQGDHGKPRPVLVVQNDLVAGIDTILVCLITTSTDVDADFRLQVMPTASNGLREPSYVMLDKTTMVLRRKCRDVVGSLTPSQMISINERLAFILGLAR
jgi:mRNA interferase MazF